MGRKRLALLALSLLSGNLDTKALPAPTSAPAPSATQAGAEETFGAQGHPTGNPIGGGAGYRRLATAGDHSVRSFDDLKAALGKAKAGQVVYVADDAAIDLTGREGLVIPSGVTLASGRGRKDSPGALIHTRQLRTFKKPNYTNVVLFLTGGENVRITGLRLRGPDPERRTVQMKQRYKEGRYYTIENSDGIRCGHAGLEVDNCELSGWSHAAVYLMPGAIRARIHHNYIHHNQREGLGYGVCLDKAEARIEANVFATCRHAIAGTGAPGTSYEACYNVVQAEDGNGHSFDMHGGKDRRDNTDVAGDSISIHHNTFEATRVWAIVIRGRPAKKAKIHHNWFRHPDPKKIVLQSNTTGNMEVYRNLYGPSKLLMKGADLGDINGIRSNGKGID